MTFESYLKKDNLSDHTISVYVWTAEYFNNNYGTLSRENLLAYNPSSNFLQIKQKDHSPVIRLEVILLIILLILFLQQFHQLAVFDSGLPEVSYRIISDTTDDA